MGTAEQLASFLKLASGNRRFRQSHLSLYSAIRSFATYHKCMGELIANGLIEYEPSYHPNLASRVTLLENNGEP